MATQRQIAILGGGPAALAAAYYLTARPGWQEEYSVTLYQLGWRLGGKCASARNRRLGDRIEEHGLHVWIGNYENAFGLMRQCYADPARPAGPVRTVDDAFLARTRMTLFEHIDGAWEPWTFDAPVLPGHPGVDGEAPTPWEVLVRVLDFAAAQADSLLLAVDSALHPPLHIPPWVQHLATRIGSWSGMESSQTSVSRSVPPRTVVHHAADLVSAAGHGGIADEELGTAISELLEFFREHVRRVIWPAAAGHALTRHACIAIDLGLTLVCGIMRDRLLTAGLGSIDGEEFQAWLRRHGAAEPTVQSSPVRALYDLCFAYRGGDPAQPCFAAGTALGVLLRVAFSYRGSVLYETKVGMGEAVIAPLYQVLHARGVRFEFFHRVTAIEASADRTTIGRVRVNRQVRLNTKEYAPLVDIGGLACWPDGPLLGQIADDDRGRLEVTGANLESEWSGWKDVESYDLEHGRDFTDVVLGISLGALRTIAAPLAEANPAWRNLLTQLPSVQTQSIQLWLTSDPTGGGGEIRRPTAVSAPESLDIWTDMTHLLGCEHWSAGNAPKSLHYICGPLPGDFCDRPSTDTSVPSVALAAIRANAVDWLSRRQGWSWPFVVEGSGTFDWGMLYAPPDQIGENRIQSQYLRANIDPTELCVLSPPGAQSVRMPSADSGFSNLVLAGDWTRTAINAACVEAAVMSGMAASRALCGFPEKIAGETFMQG